MKSFNLFALMIFIASISNAQPWTYDFGTGIGSHTATSTSVLHTDANSYLPSTQTNGGTAFTRINTGSGSFNLENPGSSLGSGSEMRAVASGTTFSLNKFSVFDYTGSNEVAMRFHVRFDGGSSGEWNFVMGNGTSFLTQFNYVNNEVFCGLKFIFGTSDAIETNYFNSTNSFDNLLTSSIISQKNNFKVEIYGNNNDATTINYTYGTAQTVPPGTYDVWIDGVLIGDNLAKGPLAANTFIDSWQFYGTSSVGNVANIYLDDISYSNSIESLILPISLLKFEAQKLTEKVKISWVTATETNNDKFIVERSYNGVDFEKVAELRGAGTSKELNEYEVMDANPFNGTSYYRLTQYDFDGTSKTFDPVAVNTSSENLSFDHKYESKELRVFSPSVCMATLKVIDLSGRVIFTDKLLLNEGYQNFSIANTNIESGIYCISIHTDTDISIKKLKL